MEKEWNQLILVGGVEKKQHKWQRREQNGGTLSVRYATLGAKGNDNDCI